MVWAMREQLKKAIKSALQLAIAGSLKKGKSGKEILSDLKEFKRKRGEVDGTR